MPGNAEEKKKCLEKLNQMQKFLPFIDFMIEKINKKNSQVSLECQLGKFHVLKSMIAEKSGRYSWDAIVKVEEIIQKLISKLDFKDQYEKPAEPVDNTDNKNCKISISTSICRVPSSATTVVSNASTSQKSETNITSQEFSTSTVDLIMKTLKDSVVNTKQKSTDKDKELLSNSLGSNQPIDGSGQTMETDLDKDLDGFDLIDSPSTFDWESSNSALEPVSAAPEKVPSHDDLLSSSREKLLKSLQSRLLPRKTDLVPSKLSASAEIGSESQSISAFSPNKIGFSERKSRSDFSENVEHRSGGDKNSKKPADVGVRSSVKPCQKSASTSFISGDKSRCDSGSGFGDANLKQRLKEKFSTEIGEVFRVPGKSVGGSLRSLNQPKTHKNKVIVEEDLLFKPDKIAKKQESALRSKSCSEKKDSQTAKTNCQFVGSETGERSRKTDKKVSYKESSNSEDKEENRADKREEIRAPKTYFGKSEKSKTPKTYSEKSQKSKSSKDNENCSSSKNFELNDINDDELFVFVKENLQYLPHLARLKPEELRKAVRSSELGDFSALGVDSDREKGDDGFHGSDEGTKTKSERPVESVQQKSSTSLVKSQHPNPSDSVEEAEGRSGEVTENSKSVTERGKESVNAGEIRDSTLDINGVSSTAKEDDLEEEDYVLKLIEETTPRVFSAKKKKSKGLLELPLPILDDLFDDISSIESFEALESPKKVVDPRLRLSENSISSTNKSENKLQSKAVSIKAASEAAAGIPSGSNVCTTPHLPRDDSDTPQNNFPLPNVSADGHELQWSKPIRLDCWSSKSVSGHGPHQENSFQQTSNRLSGESGDFTARSCVTCPKPSPDSFHKSSRCPSHGSDEPKSYAEYKRMKLKAKDKPDRGETNSKENAKSNTSDDTEVSVVLAERDDTTGNGPKKPSDPRHIKSRDSLSKHSNTQSYQSGCSYDERSRSTPMGRRFSENFDQRPKIEESGRKTDRSGRVAVEKRLSLDSEDLVSPLEELYSDERKPKTGRGYGIQNFKIPKKVRKPISQSSRSGENETSAFSHSTSTSETKAHVSSVRREETGKNVAKDPTLRFKEEESVNSEETRTEQPRKPGEKSERRNSNPGTTKDVPPKKIKKIECSKTLVKTDSSIFEASSKNLEMDVSSESPVSASQSSRRDDSKEEVSSKPPASPKEPVPHATEAERKANETNARMETVKKCEAQIAECDSSVSEHLTGNESASLVDKSVTLTSEDSKFSQEFVEALIRKSFQSGEGKRLLAQAKLFEELARKLNSKKLKTIQKIINSETESSSSSGETVSEDEKKKNKRRKLEDKSQKKKRGRKRKWKLASSCSSPEIYATKEEENFSAKSDTNGTKESESSAVKEESEEVESENNNPAEAKRSRKFTKRNKKREHGKHCVGRKASRKKREKKLLEEIMNEAPQVKEGGGRKTTTRMRGKAKTELDRLHDDIRNMFFNAGVVTPTGQRMCRILKQSGGNINNMDIVKETAKMVEEEKLKNVRNRSAPKTPRTTHADHSDSKTHPSDATSKSSPEEELQADTKSSRNSCGALRPTSTISSESEHALDPKLASEPRVILQRINLNCVGYGVKISEDCVSFKRLQGQNTALRSSGSWGMGPQVEEAEGELGRRVFLGRNRRKVERLKGKKCKKGYRGKKLSEVVEDLPLHVITMRPAETFKTAAEHVVTNQRKDLSRKRQDLKKMAASELLNYSFEKVNMLYSCNLCSHITDGIIEHYKADHPEHEMPVSRLSPEEAGDAKLEALKNSYENSFSEQTLLAESMKRKMKILMDKSALYNCRMCPFMKTSDPEEFTTHISSHTGESRFKCLFEDCSKRLFSEMEVRVHIFTEHARKVGGKFKLDESDEMVVERNKVFGFLCSVCNFVQLNRDNVVNHLSKEHAGSQCATIIKINMSTNATRQIRRKRNTVKTGAKDTLKDIESREDAFEEGFGDEVKGRKGKPSSDGESRDNRRNAVNMPQTKKAFLVKSEEENEPSKTKSDSEKLVEEEDMDPTEPADADSPSDHVNCEDFEKISALKGSNVLSSLESLEKWTRTNRGIPDAHQKLKVGPLEAWLLKDSQVLYECYVKGCLFYTRAFDQFEKHIKISHRKTKWDGVCQVCTAGRVVQPCQGNSFKLLTALRHLKLHESEKISDGKNSNENSAAELTSSTSKENRIGDQKERGKAEMNNDNTGEVNEEETSEMKKIENADAPFPSRPLLRVRNLLGDRLSTPKDSPDENEVVAIADEISTAEGSSDSMFTIENVRSLNDTPPQDNEIQIQNVCSLKDPSAPLQPLPPGKAILVRSCPSRKIAIRPETSALSIDVGQLSVVQTPTSIHPVVLAPLATASPIRIISSSLSPKPKFTVKPILVSADPAKVGSPGMLSAIGSAATSASESAETNSASQTPALTDENPVVQVGDPKPSLDVMVLTPPSKPAPPNKLPSSNKTASSISSSPGSTDIEEGEERDTITLQRFHSSPNVGNKRVKDAKIYEEMLTKTKLCHLFKCMGIECSFTCNNECVFRQHIGLHDAQRRLKNNKGMRTIFLRLANKTTRAFYWQQCAYCCELLTNTNKALSQHVLEEHGHCMYQCAFCFYRAVSHSYVEIHQNLAHSQILKTTPRVIYKCKPLRSPPSQNIALEKHGRRQSVRPYHCDQCGHKFFITQDFINHLTTQHQSVTAYTCHICKNLCFKADRLIVHYKLHSYCTYQCAYCLHGTETEKEMVFHLCNFHFSQPAVMYVRAFADGQSRDVSQKPMTKKKHLSNQLESLKVIVYESDTLNADCIVEVDPDEDVLENALGECPDLLSDIVAELGISTEAQSSSCVTPLMKELATIGDKTAKNLTVKTLLPNAQFSSETETGTETCSILISSGLSTPSDQTKEKAMDIPLGQLPLDVVNVHRNESATPPPLNSVPPDKNLKVNEIIVNLQNKDKGLILPKNEEGKQSSSAAVSVAVHKLPPVVLNRSSAFKNVYPSKNALMRKKSEEKSQPSAEGKDNRSRSTCGAKEEGESPEDSKTQKTTDSCLSAETENRSNKTTSEENSEQHPSNSSTVSSSVSARVKSQDVSHEEIPLVISDVCSLSSASESALPRTTANVQSKVSSPTEPPVIREEAEKAPKEKNFGEAAKEKEGDGTTSQPEAVRSCSPDIIILEEEKSQKIITVTLDSDDEKSETLKEKGAGKDSGNPNEVLEPADDKIRKEMELLRKQIVSETDSLLFDEDEGEKKKEKLTLTIEPPSGGPTAQSLLSPIEEAICSLNKKLQSETDEAQKKKEIQDETALKSEISASEVPKRPLTRFSGRGGGRKETAEENEASPKKEDPGKKKRMKEGLMGKDLFICGNEKCTFAADDDLTLKDHLYVCDFSRETSVLVCPHCSRQTRQFHPYLEHLRYHGEKKFHCGLCEFSSAVDASVSRHIKQKHKCSQVKVIPKESHPGHVSYYPKNHKVDKVDFEVNGYSPGDEDKLPLQSVYQVNVKCAKCPYFTKVRSNMVRHLKIHVKSVETEGVVVVPSTAPTNPVPCLETKERMFDKMTNLAASSQLAQAKEKSAIEALSAEDEAKLPQHVPEQMRYKCCLPDCNYLTVDDGMLKHHIKALHDEINYYSCPHCQNTVHVDVRHVVLDKIGHHLKHHDAKLYKCGHCIYFHYQKNVVEKHTLEKHPDRRYFVHTVREPKPEAASEEEGSSGEGGARVWKCGLCEGFRSPSKPALMDHLLKNHNIKSKYRCNLCSMKANNYQAFFSHFASKHPKEEVSYTTVYLSEKVPAGILDSGNSSGADSSSEHFDTTPLWQRGTPRVRHIRGILIEEEEIKTKKSKRTSVDESESESSECALVKENAYCCPLCTNKKKPFLTRSEDCFRTHLYQELNYQQFACILCGKMFVDKKDFDKHHARIHPDKAPAMKQTTEDHEIKFWVDQVIAKRRKQMEDRKRKLSDGEAVGSEGPSKKKKEV